MLISGPVQLTEPPTVEMIRINTAMEMLDAVMQHLKDATVDRQGRCRGGLSCLASAAAKLKKTAARMSIESRSHA